MAEEVKAEEIKGCVIYAVGIAPNPVTKFERLVSVRTRAGMFTPAIVGKASMPPNGTQELEVTFPVFSFDALGEKAFEELRDIFHKRLDKTFDEYKRRWQETQGKQAGENEELAPKTQDPEPESAETLQ